MNARRAVVRWALRLYRREWRQQALVLALLTVSVTAAIALATAAYNTAGVPGNASFGTAGHRYTMDDFDRATLADGIAAAEKRFGSVDVVAYWSRPIPGSVDSVEFRSQAVDGHFSAPLLAVHEGRAPEDHDEVALTDGVASALQADIGATIDIDEDPRTVVGIVENPSDLHEEFALVAPGVDQAAESITMLVGGVGDFDEVAALRDFGDQHLPNADITSRHGEEGAETKAAVGVLGTATIAMVLVSMVAAAGFLAIAQRRQRQLGMLGAIGATEKHLRLVVVTNGVAVGTSAALVGTIAGLAAWTVGAPRLEQSVGHRIDASNVPWWVVATAMSLVVVASTAAAWSPARAVARLPITNALSGRPPKPQPARTSAVLALVLVAVGIGCLLAADRRHGPLVVTGTVATVAGVLLISPLAVRSLTAVAAPFPIGARVALRDLARHQARSGIALAAIALALGIQVAAVVTASAAEHSIGLGNLRDDQLIVWTRDASAPEGVSPFYTQDENDDGFSPFIPDWSASDQQRLRSDVDAIAASLEGPTVIALEVASDPAMAPDPDMGGRVAVTLAQRTEIGYLDVALLFVANDEMLSQYGLEPTDVTGTDILAVDPRHRVPSQARAVIQSDGLYFANTAATPTEITSVRTLPARHDSLPGAFITPDALQRAGWQSAPVGWLVDATAPITDEALVAARDIAADAGVLIESRRPQPDLSAERWVATVAGMVLALGILAMTVGLIRSQSARDLRALTATGATSGIRRTLAAATAGTLALLGACLGITGAYLALAAGYFSDLASLSPVPLANLIAIGAGIPCVAAVVGWLLAGREPPAIARQAIE